MNTRIANKRGFTLIEVILVLAIAALIFLMVFVALPALQASQRDTARKNDASLVSSAVTNYTSAYRKAISDTSPTTQGNLRKYVTDLNQYNDSSKVVIKGDGKDASATTVPAADEIWVNYAAACNGPDAKSGNSRQATVRIALDNGTAYCVDAS